jgi:hypothetical protein
VPLPLVKSPPWTMKPGMMLRIEAGKATCAQSVSRGR